jgi:hypothetical protein
MRNQSVNDHGLHVWTHAVGVWCHIGQDAELLTLLVGLKTGASNLESALSVSKRI